MSALDSYPQAVFARRAKRLHYPMNDQVTYWGCVQLNLVIKKRCVQYETHRFLT